MCGWPVGLFFHCVSVLWVLTSKCEQIMVKNMTMLPLAVVHAGTCMFAMHVYSTTSVLFWLWKVLKASESAFGGNTKKHIFNTYAFTHALRLRRGYTRVFPSIFTIVMRIHTCVPYFLRKHIRNPHIFHRHEFADGNTCLIHSCFQFLFRRLFGKHIRIYEVSTYIWGTHARIYAFCA